MNSTIHLYDTFPDRLTFEAGVVACEAAKAHWLVALDQTAFFPEGGGQNPDRGLLGDAHVLDVHEKQGIIWHTVNRPFTVGDRVTGQVDADYRLDQSQQHTGEHIFSGLLCATYGAANVGFHIGEEVVTVDFNVRLDEEQIRALERRANAVIWADLPVVCRYPDKAELEAMPYRSKKAIDGPVRIVSIEGVDACACCGTHVPTTGCVGQIKVLSLMNYKGGIRLTMVCGNRALAAVDGLLDENTAVSRLLSAQTGALAAAVQHLLEERDALKIRRDQLSQQLFEQAAQAVAGERIRILQGDMLEVGSLRKAAGHLAEGADLAAVLLKDEAGWQFALSSTAMDVRPICQALCKAFTGKGGGTADMVQGWLASGTYEEISQLIRQTAAPQMA